MKRIRNSRAARILSWVLTVVMITPLLCGLVSPQAAYAQQGGGVAQGNVQTVIVIDFTNNDKGKTGGDALARFATDAVAVEMAQSTRFEVLKRDEVYRKANELGYRPPFDTTQLSKIATELGATAIATGEIVFVRSEGKRGDLRGVTVGMRVKLQDASSGELLNGAAQIQTAPVKPGESDFDTLTQAAVSKAAVAGVRDILNTTLPVGVITNTITNVTGGTTALINRGSRDGVKNGMEMLVLRNGVHVGKLRITNVFATDSEAVATENIQGITPQDTVRAVFPLPNIDVRDKFVDTRPRTSSSSIATLGKVLLVIAIGVVIATALKSGGSVTGVTAEADIANSAPVVRITFRNNLFGGGTLENHIWRIPDQPFNYSGVPIAALSSGITTYNDRLITSYWDGVRGFLQVPDPSNTGGGNGGNGGNGNGTAAFVVPGVTPPPPPGFPRVGDTFTYMVSAVVRRQVAQNGNNNGGNGGNTGTTVEDVETNPVNSGPATPLNQPTITGFVDGTQNVDLRAITGINFQSQRGADVFVVELSTDRTFMDRTRIVQIPLFSTAPNVTGVQQNVTSFDLTSNSLNAPLRKDPTFLNFINRVPGATRPQIFFRVGARNNADRPGPVHAITRNPKDEDRTFRYIYSLVRSFTPADMPPPPP